MAQQYQAPVNFIEPPDMSILKDGSQLNFYLTALENWEELQDFGGYPATKRAAVIFTHGFKQNPSLCKQLTDHFKKTLKDDAKGVEKIIEWLKQKFGLNKHADIVRVLNTWFNVNRNKQESLLDYITRFEAAYAQVESLGEKISATTRAVLLLRQAQLSDTDHHIITVNLSLDPLAADADRQFEQTKEAMKKFQHTRIANSSSISTNNQPATKTYLGDFIDSLQNDDSVDDQTKEEIQTYLAQRRAAGRGRGGGAGRGGGNQRGAGGRDHSKKVWKCDYCICDHKKWVDCGCPCSTHTRDKCPNPDKKKVEAFKKRKADQQRKTEEDDKKSRQAAQTERGFYGYMQKLDHVLGQEDPEKALIAKVVNVREAATPQPLNNLLQMLGLPPPPSPSGPVRQSYGEPSAQSLSGLAGPQSQVCRPQPDRQISNSGLFHGKSGDVYDVENQPQERIYVSNNDEEAENKFYNNLRMLVDTGSPSTIVGVEEFKKVKSHYPLMIQNTLRYQESSKVYEFGGGEVSPSLGRVKLPMYVVDTDGEIQILVVWVEILQQANVPFLLGGRSLKRTHSVLDLGRMTLTLTWLEREMEFPLSQHSSGHFEVSFFPLSDQDNNNRTQEYVDGENWTEKHSNIVINYLVAEAKPDISEVLYRTQSDLEKILLTKHRKGDKKPLTRKEVQKLHHVFGHANPDKLKEIIKNSGKFNEATMQAVEDLRNCEVCQVENSRIPRPRIALPRSSAFNHVLAADLKENKRFPSAGPFILYLVDCHTRFKAATFIKDKRADTVADKFVTEWIKYHGPPRYLMTDRGNEFMGGAMRDLCQFHDIRFTSSASHSPHQNAKAERGHAVVDRSLERMMTAQPSLKPDVALAWCIQAANTMQNVDGFSPFMLVFGRLPRHPTLVDINPGDSEEIINTQAKWVDQYKTMMQAREAFAGAEADRVLRKGLEQRIYSHHENIKRGDWIYFKRNCDRSWQGPAKLVLRDQKSLHLVRHGSPICVNSDDVLLHKPDMAESSLEDFVRLPQKSQPTPSGPVRQSYGEPSAQSLSGLAGPQSQVRLQSPVSSPTNRVSFHENPIIIPDVPGPAENEKENNAEDQQGGTDRDVTQDPEHNKPATSTSSSVRDLGDPMVCNLCHKEFSSLNIVRHLQLHHGISHPSVRNLATMSDRRPDSIYENVDNLRPGVVMASQLGEYLVLVSPTSEGWRVRNMATQEESELELIKEMTELRFIGQLDSQEKEGLYVIRDGIRRYYSNTDYQEKVFFTAQEQYEPEIAYVVNIPRSRHGEPRCVAAKMKELDDFSNYDVYDIVDRPTEPGANIISCQWVLVEKEKPDGTTVTKARLCVEGNLEQNKHLVPVDSPTVNPISVRLLATIGASQGHVFQTADVQRAFLQSDIISRDVYVKPPPEMNLPKSRVLKLKRTAYGLVDASRQYYLKQARELISQDFKPSKLDPALFIHKKQGQEMYDVATAVHVDDALSVGQEKAVNKAQTFLNNKFTYGTVERLPFRFLGHNYKQDQEGNLSMDTAHYVENLELPDPGLYSHLTKQDILPDDLQTVFRSMASKLNTVSRSVRPDFSYQAKYLTTRYGKATKSDLTQAVKLMKKAKEESTEVSIPNIGEPEDWLLVGVADASHRKGAELFAVGGHVLILMNKHSQAASVLHWSSKKIDRVCQSSSAAETIALEKLFSTIYFTRNLLKELCGERVKDLKCIAMTDNQALYSNIHHLKSNTEDFRLQSDIISIRQSIENDKIVQELRYCHSEENISDCLTKVTKNGIMLLNIVRTGIFNPPGGTIVRDSTMLAVRTWNQLIQAEAQTKNREISSKNPKEPPVKCKTFFAEQQHEAGSSWRSPWSLSRPWPGFSTLQHFISSTVIRNQQDKPEKVNKSEEIMIPKSQQQKPDLQIPKQNATNPEAGKKNKRRPREQVKKSKKTSKVNQNSGQNTNKTPPWMNIKYEEKRTDDRQHALNKSSQSVLPSAEQQRAASSAQNSSEVKSFISDLK